jgi:hypothetical protein
MTNEQIFELWAPETSPWSCWAKPVLFSYLSAVPTPTPTPTPPSTIPWPEIPASDVALVIDLPGPASVHFGLLAARNGFRPVPLFNAIPLAHTEQSSDLPSLQNLAVIDLLPIMTALIAGADELRNLPLSPEAPPAFLLDDRRRGPLEVGPDQFDNRSVCYTTDFPSANFLLARQINRALLITEHDSQPAADLAHTLRKWQEGGISIDLKRLDTSGPPALLHVPRPPWFGAFFQRALVAVGLRPSATAGFGNWPVSGSGG